MPEINIDPKAVRKAASDLRSCTSQLRDKTGTFDTIIDEIECAWKSRYTQQYIAILESTERDIERILRSIDTAAGNLDSIAVSVEKAEAELQNIMSRNGGSGGGGGGSW